MKYIDKYPKCEGCPVTKYCGTMVASMKLCNSYGNITPREIKPEQINPEEVWKQY